MKTFTYSKGKQKDISLLFLGLGILGAAFALYTWFWADPINLMVLVGGAFLAMLGLVVFLKRVLTPTKENETAISISEKGITAITTPVAKAAGLIEWADITHIQLYERMLEIQLKAPEKYAARMRSFFVRDAFLNTLKGTIKISFLETNASYEELKVLLRKYVPLIQ
ncbi:MAG TPA: STM3941 family protein [Sphingobacterium sp.]|nr:STM3941 family protein [Sphingobacterium sp.]